MEWEPYVWPVPGGRPGRDEVGTRVAPLARRLLIRERARARRLEPVLFLAGLRDLERRGEHGRDASGAKR